MLTTEAVMEIMNSENFVAIEDVEIQCNETPELLLISKEAFVTLSEEARDLVKLIMYAPNRLYKVNGQLKTLEFQKYCKRRKGWGHRKVEELKFELAFFCKAAVLR